jgi:AcrR family transcriptional regulator
MLCAVTISATRLYPRDSPRKAARLTPKGQRARTRIVEAAARLMFEQGVAETTIEQVREAAGVSNSQIYHYFPGKNVLVQAVIEHQANTIVGGQQPMFDRLDTMDGLRAWRDFLVAHQRQLRCRGGCPLGSLGVEVAETDDTARVQVAASFVRWEVGIRTGLRQMHAAGRLAAAADPDALALALLGALQGGLMLTQLHRDTRPLETTLDAMLTLIATQTI